MSTTLIHNQTRLECDGALSDLILQAARQAIPGHVDRLITLPDSGRRNKPFLPLLVGLLDAAQQVARAVADNAWDESLPLDRELMTTWPASRVASPARSKAPALALMPAPDPWLTQSPT
jgi:hypothetical protein